MTEDTYTHRPGRVEEDRGGRERDDESEVNPGPDSEVTDPAVADPEVTNLDEPVERGREEWDWRGWVLVGVVVLCFLVIPATILVLPPVRPFRFAYLVLPLIPAFLLGAVAVWSAQRSD